MFFVLIFFFGFTSMHSHTRLLVAGGFLVKDNKVLLALRENTSGDNGVYGLIGGKVELGEPIHEALIREIYEEVGVCGKT